MVEFNDSLMEKRIAKSTFTISDDEFCVAYEGDGAISDKAESVKKGDEVWVFKGVNSECKNMLFAFVPRVGYATEVHFELLK